MAFNTSKITEIVRDSYEQMEGEAARDVPLTGPEILALISFTNGVYPLKFDHLVSPLQAKLRAALRPEGSLQ